MTFITNAKETATQHHFYTMSHIIGGKTSPLDTDRRLCPLILEVKRENHPVVRVFCGCVVLQPRVFHGVLCRDTHAIAVYAVFDRKIRSENAKKSDKTPISCNILPYLSSKCNDVLIYWGSVLIYWRHICLITSNKSGHIVFPLFLNAKRKRIAAKMGTAIRDFNCYGTRFL